MIPAGGEGDDPVHPIRMFDRRAEGERAALGQPPHQVCPIEAERVQGLDHATQHA